MGLADCITRRYFDKIDLAKCRPNKDFDQGFYLTDIRSQAEAMAVRRCEFEETGNPIVQEYEFDEHIIDSQEFKVKIFDGVSQEWAEFILMNRMITMETLIKELTFSHLNNQYFFGTERAIQQLKRV